MKTICIDCRYIGPRPSGIGEVVQGLVDFLPDLAPDLDFLLLKHPAVKTRLNQADNVREVTVPQAANGPATLWWLAKVVDLSDVSLFHATFNIMPAGLRMPCVTTIHDIMWLTHPQWCNPTYIGWIERFFYSHGLKRALQRSAAITTVSTASRDEIAAWTPGAADRIFAIPSGISLDFRPAHPDPSALARLGISVGRKFVLTVGQYAPYKNHEGVLQAFALAFPTRDDIDLVLVQRRGKRMEKLLALADRLGLSGRVHWLGSIERSDLVNLYSAAAALLHPSFCEGFGNPLAEAMACGCPVITSNVSAMPEVTNGAALLADPREPEAIAAALRQVVDDPLQADALRKSGLARASQLNWRDFAASHLDIYRKVLKGA